LRGCAHLNQNKLLQVLVSLGVKRFDAEIYLFLLTKGPKKGREISRDLNISEQQVYRGLKNLRKKNLIKAFPEYPVLFTAVTIEEAFNSFKEAKLEEVQFIKEKRDELLSRWQIMLKKNSANGQ
jgi:sugar-specific transcriptional regulator TrmB